MLAVVLIGLVGLSLLPESIHRILVGVPALSGLLVWFPVSKPNEHPLQLPVLRRWRDEVQVSAEGIRSLASPKLLFVAIGLEGLAWLHEGMVFWLILQGLDTDIVALRALPIYASATVAGSITT